jgi:serine/threonine protein phosphatase PrpC
MKGWRPSTRAWAATRRGASHERNEDAYCLLDSPSRTAGSVDRGVIYAVSDGVSTGARGDWASQLAVERLGQFYERNTSASKDAVIQIIGEVDWELRGEKKGQAACTLAAVWIHRGELHLFQVGDSHVFRIRGGEMHCLTHQEGHGRKLNHFLGMGPSVSEVMRTKSGPVEAGDVFVMITDGISEAVDADLISALWTSARGDPATCAEAIIGAVARANVNDDATVLVALIL